MRCQNTRTVENFAVVRASFAEDPIVSIPRRTQEFKKQQLNLIYIPITSIFFPFKIILIVKPFSILWINLSVNIAGLAIVIYIKSNAKKDSRASI